jgi:hypothetical protein
MFDIAYGTGQGVRNVREQQRQDDLAKFNAQLRLSYAGLNTRLYDNHHARELRRDLTGQDIAYKQGRDDTYTRNRQVLTQMGIDANRESQLLAQQGRLDLVDEQSRQYTEQIEAKDRLDRERSRWEYSELQMKEKEKIDQGRAWVSQEFAAGRFTQQEVDSFNHQLDAREHGILPMRKYSNEPTPDEIMAQRISVDPETGDKLYIEPNGRIKNLTVERQQIELKKLELAEQLRIKRQDAYAKAYIETYKALTSKDSMGNEKMPTAAEVTAVLQGMYPELDIQQSDIEQETEPQGSLTGMQIEELDQIWKDGRKNLSGGFMGWGHASQEDMALFMQQFVAKAAENGIDEKQAEDYFLKKWKSEASNRGLFTNDKVPGFKGGPGGSVNAVAEKFGF